MSQCGCGYRSGDFGMWLQVGSSGCMLVRAQQFACGARLCGITDALSDARQGSRLIGYCSAAALHLER
jgi:hypothetical protein